MAPAGIPAITEFMALNSASLTDQDGEFSDWIEIQNVGDQTLNLVGWRLTDDAANPAKWSFPSYMLGAGQRLIVFASGKDRTSGGEFHTNFSLSGDGEYLALISPAGSIASQFNPYPPQFEDVSYGLGSEAVGGPLFSTGDELRALVPSDNALGTNWTGGTPHEPFDDSTAAGWLHGPAGVGFDLGGPVSPPEQVVGHALIDRPARDGAIGSIFMLESQRFSGPGLITSWSIYSDIGGQVTPLLLQANEFGEYEITAVGATRAVTGGGQQTFAFDLQSGNASVDTNVVFAWKDGSNGVNHAGVADYTNGTADSVRWFQQHTNFTVGENLGVGEARNRTYSLRAAATAAFALEPVAYWSLDGHVNDETGGGAQGELRGPAFVGQVPLQIGSGQSLSFDGNDYVSVPLDVPETNYSSSMWFRTSTPSRGLFAVVDSDLGVGGHDRHLFLSGGNIAARTWNNETIASSGKNYADGQWHLVVHVVGAAAGGQQIYVDGQLVASGAKSGSDFDWQQRVNIGFSNDAPGNYFVGEIDDVAIWPAVLSPSQITTLYQGASPIALSGYSPWVGLDLAEVFNGHSSAYVRSTIEVADPSVIDSLELDLRYDDAVAVYLNGVEIARRNAPASLAFDSVAVSDRGPAVALRGETIDIPLPPGLLRAGSNVLAYHLLGDSTHDQDLLLAPEVWGLRSLGNRYLSPTPGEGNGHGVLGFIEAPAISIPHGFYDQPFTTSITSQTPGVEIYYTLNGSVPDPSNPSAVPYAGPLSITGTTTLRAAAFKADHEPSPIATATYLFLSDIEQQPSLPPGYPTHWAGGALADYGIDPDVVNNTLPGYGFDEALLALPTVSIVTPFEDLWSSSSGIYYNSGQRGRAWEREASIELIYPDGSNFGFQVDAGIRMHGNSSRNHGFTPKHPIRIEFRSEYGPGRLQYPLFADSEVDTFDQLLLRGSSTDSWPVIDGSFVQGVQRWNPDHATYLRDQWMRDAQNEMGMPSPHGTYVHLFLNGLYWGQYNIAERPTSDFQASNFGGEDEEYDVIKDFAELESGTKDAWNQLFSLAASGFATEAAYQRIQGNNPDGTPNENYPVLLDVEALIDYMILHIYSGAEDWPDHNYWAARRRGPESEGFRFFVWDQEISNDSLVREYTRISTRFENPIGGQNPSYLYGQLMQNDTWRGLFIDRVHELLFNDGLLTPDQNHARWMVRQMEIDQSIVAESARWGDYRDASPYTRESDWLGEMNWMRDVYWPQIHPIALNRFRAVGLYPDVAAPSFSQHGGQFAFGGPLTITAPAGDIYYTLDGTDPRDNGALLYSGPVPLNDSVVVKTRAVVAGEWSALTFAPFQVHEPASASTLAVTEVNYHAHAPSAAELAINPAFSEDDFDFIELQNVSDRTIDLHDVDFVSGITFNFSGSAITTLAPGEFVVIVENAAAFAARYGNSLPVAGVYDGSLRNSGERLLVLDRFDATIRDFEYLDGGDWPGRADGDGSTLEAIDPTANMTLPAAWRPSAEFGGSPGYAGSGMAGDIVINEVLTHTDLPALDYVELYNTTDAPIDISHWALSDSTSNYTKFQVPPDTVLGPGEYLTFDENDFNPGRGALPNDFALDAVRGETLSLLAANASGQLLRFADVTAFGAAANGEAWGRWPNGEGELYPMLAPTHTAANSGPRVGPVIISELMYHPPAVGNESDHLEYIELLNTSGQPVNLTHWSISGISAFTFPPGLTLPPQQVLVVVPFNPDDPNFETQLDDFRATYNLDPSTLLAGGYSGRLDNAGERIALFRSDDPPAEEPTYYPQLLEDRVTYSDTAPWPAAADGSGMALVRQGCGSWGDAPTSWVAASPSPGVAACASVAGRHVFYEGSAFDTGGDAGDDAAIATHITPLFPGQTATAANYTNFARGINGVIVDLAFRETAAPLTAADFEFRVGNTDAPATWPLAPPPSITTRIGQGSSGADRVVLRWPDGAITNTWLQITLRATANTGLLTDDVFYFGNAIGDTENSTSDAAVDADDFVAVRANPHSFLAPAAIDNPYDTNRDQRVNATDLLIVRENATTMATQLRFIAPAAAPQAKSVAGQELPQLVDAKPFDLLRSDSSERKIARRPATLPWHDLAGESPGFDDHARLIAQLAARNSPLPKHDSLSPAAYDELFALVAANDELPSPLWS